ncbi:MAG: hypothetical protein U1E35_01845 [Rhodospirillales bacterium]
MQERLNTLSWPSWGGGILATIGTVPVAGVAGHALTGAASLPETCISSISIGAGGSAHREPPPPEGDGRRGALAEKRFLNHPWYSPRHQTIIVSSLYSLKRASGRPSFIAAAMAAGSEQDAFAMQRTAELLRAFNEYASPLTEIAAPDGVIVARAADGATVVPLYADRGVWTPGTQALADAWDRDAAAYPTASRKVLWVSGRLSPEMAEAVRRRGWLVEDQIFERHLLAYEYQEQMAIKESLMGERIFPRIGD